MYATFNSHLEMMEKAHLERVDNGTDASHQSYVLRAFPKEAEALQNEWKSKLGSLVGTNRADFLDPLLRRGAFGAGGSVILQSGERGTGARGGGGAGAGPRAGSPALLGGNWLQRGKGETRFDFTINPPVNGRPSISLQFRGDNASGGGGFGGAFSESFKHLFTPESLLVPPVKGL